MNGPVLRSNDRFWWLRLLVAFSPGFGMFLFVKLFVYLESCFPIVRSFKDWKGACLLTLVAAFFALAMGTGWFCAMLEPAFSGIDGERKRRDLIRYVAIFVAFQIGLTPIMFEITVAATGSFLP